MAETYNERLSNVLDTIEWLQSQGLFKRLSLAFSALVVVTGFAGGVNASSFSWYEDRPSIQYFYGVGGERILNLLSNSEFVGDRFRDLDTPDHDLLKEFKAAQVAGSVSTFNWNFGISFDLHMRRNGINLTLPELRSFNPHEGRPEGAQNEDFSNDDGDACGSDTFSDDLLAGEEAQTRSERISTPYSLDLPCARPSSQSARTTTDSQWSAVVGEYNQELLRQQQHAEQQREDQEHQREEWERQLQEIAHRQEEEPEESQVAVEWQEERESQEGPRCAASDEVAQGNQNEQELLSHDTRSRKRVTTTKNKRSSKRKLRA